MKVCGYNRRCQLGEKSNENGYSGYPCISNLCDSHINVESLSSFSTFSDHTVFVNKNGRAFCIGSNNRFRIISTLPSDTFEEETEIILSDSKKRPCHFISAVCGEKYTLYLVKIEGISNNQLVYTNSNSKNGTPIFLNINGRNPIKLYGGSKKSAAIDEAGEVIMINDGQNINFCSLGKEKKAVCVACCNDTFVAIDSAGQVFEYNEHEFVLKSELKNKKITYISGTYEHFLAVSDDGEVFVEGRNSFGRCGTKSKSDTSNFIKIQELVDYKIISAAAGYTHSLFITSKGEILSCGSEGNGQLLLTKGLCSDTFYSPVKTVVTNGASFCIAGDCITVVFFGNVPPNTPNTPVKYAKKINLSKYKPSTTEVTDVKADDVTKLKREIEKLKKENEELRKEIEVKKVTSKEVIKSKQENSILQRNEELEKEVLSLKRKIKSLEKGNKNKEEQLSLNFIDISVLNELEQIKEIGRGATSVVYEVARKERLAHKVLLPQFILTDKEEDDDDEEENKLDISKIKRFFMEYEVLSRLNHPNIIKVYGFFIGDSQHMPSILLEYCPTNLKRSIKKLSREERKTIIIEISNAMKTIHSFGIIHRDIKLENILLDSNNHVKIGDFGLCKLLNPEEQTSTFSQIGGTLKYMAPELVQEKTDYNEKVDVYAFGVVVYQIHMKGEFPKISLYDVGAGKIAPIPSTISKFSADLIKKCWSYKPSERPSFEEICNMLKGNENLIC